VIEPEGKVLRESVRVPAHLLVEGSCCRAIEFREITVEHHLLAADQVDPAGNTFYGDNRGRPGHVAFCIAQAVCQDDYPNPEPMLQSGLDRRLRFGLKRAAPHIVRDGHLRHPLARLSF
jgi:hypothetical protein